MRNGEMFPEGPRKDGGIFAAAAAVAPAAAELVGGDAWLGEKLLRSLDLSASGHLLEAPDLDD